MTAYMQRMVWPGVIAGLLGTVVASAGAPRGSILGWGENKDGQTDVPAPNLDFVAVAAGYWHGLGLKANGSVVTWGDDLAGQTPVPTPNTGFVAIAGGATTVSA